MRLSYSDLKYMVRFVAAMRVWKKQYFVANDGVMLVVKTFRLVKLLSVVNEPRGGFEERL